jgi:hypothetical protein
VSIEVAATQPCTVIIATQAGWLQSPRPMSAPWAAAGSAPHFQSLGAYRRVGRLGSIASVSRGGAALRVPVASGAVGAR